MSVIDGDELPDYLDADQIGHLGFDPEDLDRLGLQSLTGNDRRPCWPRDVVLEWLGGNSDGRHP
jgi:hypothetical protein